MIHVLAQITLTPGSRDAFLEQFHQVMPHVLAEEGCLEYGPAVDLKTSLDVQKTDEQRVVVIEKWESVAHLEAHLVAPHMNAYREQVKDFVASVELQVLQPA